MEKIVICRIDISVLFFFFFLHQNKDRGEKKSNNPGIKITIEYGK